MADQAQRSGWSCRHVLFVGVTTIAVVERNAPGEQVGGSHADVVLSQLSQKIMRVLRKAQKKAEAKPVPKTTPVTPKLSCKAPGATKPTCAASIIGHIRRASLGEPSVFFEQRDAQAMQRISTGRPRAAGWSVWPNNWCARGCDRLAIREHLLCDVGEAKRPNKVLNNQTDIALDAINDALREQNNAQPHV